MMRSTLPLLWTLIVPRVGAGGGGRGVGGGTVCTLGWRGEERREGGGGGGGGEEEEEEEEDTHENLNRRANEFGDCI